MSLFLAPAPEFELKENEDESNVICASFLTSLLDSVFDPENDSLIPPPGFAFDDDSVGCTLLPPTAVFSSIGHLCDDPEEDCPDVDSSLSSSTTLELGEPPAIPQSPPLTPLPFSTFSSWIVSRGEIAVRTQQSDDTVSVPVIQLRSLDQLWGGACGFHALYSGLCLYLLFTGGKEKDERELIEKLHNRSQFWWFWSRMLARLREGLIESATPLPGGGTSPFSLDSDSDPFDGGQQLRPRERKKRRQLSVFAERRLRELRDAMLERTHCGLLFGPSESFFAVADISVPLLAQAMLDVEQTREMMGVFDGIASLESGVRVMVISCLTHWFVLVLCKLGEGKAEAVVVDSKNWPYFGHSRSELEAIVLSKLGSEDRMKRCLWRHSDAMMNVDTVIRMCCGEQSFAAFALEKAVEGLVARFRKQLEGADIDSYMENFDGPICLRSGLLRLLKAFPDQAGRCSEEVVETFRQLVIEVEPLLSDESGVLSEDASRKREQMWDVLREILSAVCGGSNSEE